MNGGEPISLTATPKSFQNVPYVSLTALMAPLGGVVQVTPTRIQVQLEGVTTTTGINDLSVSASSGRFTLTHPVVAEAGTAYIALEDAVPFLKQGFQMSLTRVERGDPVQLNPSTPVESPADERTEDLLGPTVVATPLIPAAPPTSDTDALQAAAPPITPPAAQTPTSPLPGPVPGAARPPIVAEGPVSLVVLDAGHGGNDVGTTSPSGAQEKVITLALAEKVGELLRNGSGLKVLITRSEDRALSIGERAALANKSRAGLLVSLHSGASPGKGLPEIQVFHSITLEGGGDEAVLADRAQAMAANLVREVSAGDNAPSAALYAAPLRLQTILAMPCLLVEIGALNTPEGEALLLDQSRMGPLAACLAKAIALATTS